MPPQGGIHAYPPPPANGLAWIPPYGGMTKDSLDD